MLGDFFIGDKVMAKLMALIATLLFSACAANSGIVDIGSGTYFVSRQAATGFTGMGTLKAEALKEAGEHCGEMGKSVEVISATDAQPPFVFGNYPKTEIQFKCVAAQVQ